MIPIAANLRQTEGPALPGRLQDQTKILPDPVTLQDHQTPQTDIQRSAVPVPVRTIMQRVPAAAIPQQSPVPVPVRIKVPRVQAGVLPVPAAVHTRPRPAATVVLPRAAAKVPADQVPVVQVDQADPVQADTDAKMPGLIEWRKLK